MIHDILLDRYLHHGEAWYTQQAANSRAKLGTLSPTSQGTATPPASLSTLDALDDLGVALANLHQLNKAIAAMRQKLSLLPSLEVEVPNFVTDSRWINEATELDAIADATNLSPEIHHQYTARANLGTFLIHDSLAKALAGDASAKRDLAEGLRLIQESVVINPGAHFGREKWQALVVQFFLASIEQPKLLTQLDVIGNPLDGWTEPYFSKPDYFGGRLGVAPSAGYLDQQMAAESRASFRKDIRTTGDDPAWASAINAPAMMPPHFDEPALALIGMWTLGGGPNPHFALALAHIAEQIGQLQVAWDGYQRALDLQTAFSPDAAIRAELIAHCQARQDAIARVESPDDPHRAGKLGLEESLHRTAAEALISRNMGTSV